MATTEDLVTNVRSELAAQWNEAVIAKPNIYHGEEGRPVKDTNTLFVIDGEAAHEIADALRTADRETTPFSITGSLRSKDDARLVHDEVRRIINAKSVTNGWWRVTAHVFTDLGTKQCSYNCRCEQVKIVDY